MWYSNDTDRAECMKDFTHFLYRHEAYVSPSIVKCLECEGSGRIYDPDDPRDVIEGNKMRRTITCPSCKGLKIGKLSEWKSLWKKEKKALEVRNAKEAKEAARRKRILKKLTKADIDFLGLRDE